MRGFFCSGIDALVIDGFVVNKSGDASSLVECTQ